MMKDGTVRDVGLKQVQAALERACCLQEYDDALSLCGREAPAEGLWAKDEEEALLLTVLLIVAPDHQWEPALQVEVEDDIKWAPLGLEV
jgi:hypothetical protein